jgi:DNA-binding MarR family transcriptional regulator
MTHRLSGLEKAGLIRRIPDPEDGRGLLVELTSKGVDLVDQVTPEHLANEHRLLASLSQEEQTTLIELLRKLLVEFEREHPVPPAGGRGGRHKTH